ncbi:MAG: hypothetical protein AB9903_25075 [Vulcanimicrobiota bacterium]
MQQLSVWHITQSTPSQEAGEKSSVPFSPASRPSSGRKETTSRRLGNEHRHPSLKPLSCIHNALAFPYQQNRAET